MPDLVHDWAQRLIEANACLARHPRGRLIATIAGEALAAVDPRAAVLRSTHLLRKPKGEAAVVGEYVFDLADDPNSPGPNQHGRMHVFGAGKASAAMAAAIVERFGARVAGGVVIVKHAPGGLTPALTPARPDDPEGLVGRIGAVEIMLGDHPVPGPRTATAAAHLRRRARDVGPRDLVLCPISGGASALLSEPTLAPADWSALHELLLARDVSIQAINLLRRRFDALKAGGLARLLAPAAVVGLIISDVVGDELALVGSGPTVYASSTEDAEYQAVLGELDEGLATLEPTLRRALASPPPLPSHPRVGDRPQGVHQVLLARNGDAREAACRRAQAEGLDSIVLLPALGGLAADEGRRLARVLAQMPADLPVRAPACLVTGGETTVSLGAHAGLGGRNQELALAAIEGLAGVPDVALLSLASDGEDGPTDAAGALVTGDSFAQANALGLDLTGALANHDSHRVFAQLDDLIRTGPTGTNVCDLGFLFRFA